MTNHDANTISRMSDVKLAKHWADDYVAKHSLQQLEAIAARDPEQPGELQHASRVWQEVQRREQQKARTVLL